MVIMLDLDNNKSFYYPDYTPDPEGVAKALTDTLIPYADKGGKAELDLIGTTRAGVAVVGFNIVGATN